MLAEAQEKCLSRAGALKECWCNVTNTAHADLQVCSRITCLLLRFSIKIHEWTESRGLTTDDRDHERKAKRTGAGK
jgi:hypothetical protein